MRRMATRAFARSSSAKLGMTDQLLDQDFGQFPRTRKIAAVKRGHLGADVHTIKLNGFPVAGVSGDLKSGAAAAAAGSDGCHIIRADHCPGGPRTSDHRGRLSSLTRGARAHLLLQSA